MFNFSAYSAQRPLLDAARPKAQIWRLIIGLILVAGVFLLSNQFVHQTLFSLLGSSEYIALTSVSGGSSQLSVLFLLFSFAFLFFGVVVALKVAHARGFLAVFGEQAKLRQQFWAVLAFLVLINVVVVFLPPWDLGAPLVSNVPPLRWLAVLPFAILAVLVQVTAEEFLFRGYLQQQLAARFRSPLIWILVPSLMFGLGHYMPTEAGENARLIVVWSVVFGILMADLTARAGTLGPAIAIHFVNNFLAIVVISMPDTLSGLSLFLSPFSMTDTDEVRAWLPVDFAMMVVSWLAARLAIRR